VEAVKKEKREKFPDNLSWEGGKGKKKAKI